jgi:hypothetical protein
MAEHHVLAVNTESNELLITDEKGPGTVQIDKYTIGREGILVDSLVAGNADVNVWAHYAIGEEKFAIPLGSNIGPAVLSVVPS